MTQEDLSVKIDSTQKYVSSIERGIGRPSLTVYLRIANVFHVSMDFLLCDLIVTETADSTSNRIVQAFAEDLMQVIRRYLDNQ